MPKGDNLLKRIERLENLKRSRCPKHGDPFKFT